MNEPTNEPTNVPHNELTNVPHNEPLNEDPVVSTNHGYDWYAYKNPDDLPLNGQVRSVCWQIRLATGDTIRESGDVTRELSPLDYFFCSFPEEQTLLTLQLTNEQLRLRHMREMTRGEFYKLLGILILIT